MEADSGRAGGRDPVTPPRVPPGGGVPPGRGGVLGRSPRFRRLWMSRSVSHVGDGAALIALLIYVKQSQPSGLAVGGLLLAQSLPHLLGPVAGTIVDRVNLRSVMVGCEMAQAALFAAIAWWQPAYPVLLAMVVAAAVLDTTFGPAAQSAVPALIEPRDLTQANAWIATSLNLQVAIGPILGGLLVSAFGTRGGLGANSLSFAVSGTLLLGLHGLDRPAPAAPRRGILAEGRAGLAFAWREPFVRALLILVFLFVTFAAVDNVALVFLTRDSLHSGVLGFGVVAAAYGLGMLAGSIALSTFPERLPSLALLMLGTLLSGLGTIATGLAPGLGVAALTQAGAGLGNGIDNVARTTLVQRAVPPQLLGRVFGLIGMAAFGGSAVSYALTGVLLDATSPRVVFVVGGAGALAALLTVGPFLLLAARRPC